MYPTIAVKSVGNSAGFTGSSSAHRFLKIQILNLTNFVQRCLACRIFIFLINYVLNLKSIQFVGNNLQNPGGAKMSNGPP